MFFFVSLPLDKCVLTISLETFQSEFYYDDIRVCVCVLNINIRKKQCKKKIGILIGEYPNLTIIITRKKQNNVHLKGTTPFFRLTSK